MLNQACKTKIGKLLPMLTTDKPGELVNAVSAINKVLKSHNSNIHELTAVLTQDPANNKMSPSDEYIYKRQILSLKLEIERLKISNLGLLNENSRLKADKNKREAYITKMYCWVVILILVAMYSFLKG